MLYDTHAPPRRGEMRGDPRVMTRYTRDASVRRASSTKKSLENTFESKKLFVSYAA